MKLQRLIQGSSPLTEDLMYWFSLKSFKWQLLLTLDYYTFSHSAPLNSQYNKEHVPWICLISCEIDLIARKVVFH